MSSERVALVRKQTMNKYNLTNEKCGGEIDKLKYIMKAWIIFFESHNGEWNKKSKSLIKPSEADLNT